MQLNATSLLTMVVISALAWNALAGLRTGKALMFYNQVRRSDDPVGFWTAVAISAGLSFAAALSLVLT